MATPDPRRGDEPGDPNVTPAESDSLDDEKGGSQIEPVTPGDDSDKGSHPPTIDE